MRIVEIVTIGSRPDLAHLLAVYVEPNIWVHHHLGR